MTPEEERREFTERSPLPPKPDATVEEMAPARKPEEILLEFIRHNVLSYRMERVGPGEFRHNISADCEHCQAIDALDTLVAVANGFNPVLEDAMLLSETVRLMKTENDSLRHRLEDVIQMLQDADKQGQRLQDQLDAVDRALPRWETDRGFDPIASGRVQTILNLIEDREGLETYKGYVEQLRQNLKACHTDRQHKAGLEIAAVQTKLDDLMAYLKSSPDVPPAVVNKIKKEIL